MKNIFAITFGTSDIQFDSDSIAGSDFEFAPPENPRYLRHKKHSDIEISIKINRNRSSFLPLSPRNGGRIILDKIDLFLPILTFPLIVPVVEEITVKQGQIIDMWLFVTTDQENVPEHHWNGDTLYYGEIFKRKIQSMLTDCSQMTFHSYSVKDKLTDIDYQYCKFHSDCKSVFNIPESEINSIYLLTQGGIDQINQALTLQLLQAYKNKIHQWQKAEDQIPRQLHFSDYFLADLNKQKVLKHLEDYDFGLISEFTEFLPAQAIELARYANYRQNLDYSNTCPDYQSEIITTETKCRDLYLSAKIYFKRGDYGNYLWRLFTLLENVYRFKCEPVLGDTEQFYNPRDKENLPWITKLSEVAGLYDFLMRKKMGKWPLEVRQPSRYLYKHAYVFLCNNGKLEENLEIQNRLNFVFRISSGLVTLRNDIAHYLKPVSKSIIEDAMDGKSCEELNDNLDYIFGLKGRNVFGIFDEIREKIMKMI